MIKNKNYKSKERGLTLKYSQLKGLPWNLVWISREEKEKKKNSAGDNLPRKN
jgi:hypothetical protein